MGLRNDKFQFSSSQQLIALAVVMVQRKVARIWRGMKKLEANRIASETESEIALLNQIESDSLLEIEPPGADPHTRWFGRGPGSNPGPIPIQIVLSLYGL